MTPHRLPLYVPLKLTHDSFGPARVDRCPTVPSIPTAFGTSIATNICRISLLKISRQYVCWPRTASHTYGSCFRPLTLPINHERGRRILRSTSGINITQSQSTCFPKGLRDLRHHLLLFRRGMVLHAIRVATAFNECNWKYRRSSEVSCIQDCRAVFPHIAKPRLSW